MRAPDVVTAAVTRADGGVTVLRIIINEYDAVGEVRAHYEPTLEYVQSLIDQYVRDSAWTGPLAPVSWRFVDNDYGDADRTYRNAWLDESGPRPGHDMLKAREIHRERIRLARAPLLEDLDVEYQRADERGSTTDKTLVAARKQALRDATEDPMIDAAQTVADLLSLPLPT